MSKEIKFSLIYRDMWQSSGKYQPRVDQLKQIAPVIIDMGCFSRIETNGGAFEQVQLLYGENPNTAVREWTKPFNEAGIQTHMLERALNGIRMFPVPADVRRLMFKVKKAQGVDIARSFCGLNDHRNLELSIKYAKEAGMISQAALSITHSVIHTVDYFLGVVDKAVEYGADEICLKDMAGIGRPSSLGKLVRAIKEKYPHIIVQYHGHSGPGFSVSSMLEVARAGADYIDVAMEPLSWGMVHPDVITIRELLKDDGFIVPDLNMNAYMEARALTQEFIDEFLGLFIDPKNRYLSSLLIQSGLPGGMMGSLMADLKGIHQAINMNLKAKNEPELNEDGLLVKMFEEVAYIWPKLGYPPLVTPFSQYVKNTALMNVFQMAKGEERFSMIDKNTWDMILGKAGKLPGPLAPEILALAEKDNKVFYEGVPQEAYPDKLPEYISEMEKNGWDRGEDDEDLFEFAMHEDQYRDYKNGSAKKRFEEECEKIRSEKELNNTKMQITKKEKPNRSAYAKNDAGKETAAIALILFTMQMDKQVPDNQCCSLGNIWSQIGYWRHLNNIEVVYQDAILTFDFEQSAVDEYLFIYNNEEYKAKLLYKDDTEMDFALNNKKYFASLSPCEDAYKIRINQNEFCMNRSDLLGSAELRKSGSASSADEDSKIIYAPIPGKIFRINVSEGDVVKNGDVVLVIDAMKMENNIVVKCDGVVKELKVALNDMVDGNAPLLVLE